MKLQILKAVKKGKDLRQRYRSWTYSVDERLSGSDSKALTLLYWIFLGYKNFAAFWIRIFGFLAAAVGVVLMIPIALGQAIRNEVKES